MTVETYTIIKSEEEFERNRRFYHTKPNEETLAEILINFWKYRFENAVKAIWLRNPVVTIYFGLYLTFLSPFMFLAKKLFLAPKNFIIFPSITKTYIHTHFVKGDGIGVLFSSLFVLVIGLTKLTWDVLYLTGWVIIMLLRYIIIPLIRALGGFAIAFALIFGKKRFIR